MPNQIVSNNRATRPGAGAFRVRVLILLSSAGLLFGCATQRTLDTLPETPEIVEEALPEGTTIPDQFTTPGWDTGAVDDGWIAAFGDPELEALVDEAIAHNLDLQVAGARVAGLKAVSGWPKSSPWSGLTSRRDPSSHPRPASPPSGRRR